ncbi:SET domain-containing protein-lysine N-methyltransferase [Pseudomonas sp. DWRC2-2]|uniref:SET domain-containing protein-lysine N-methyltransferase n=1 Tax=Pseudomonas sp. DWRC2-2 TaxID=2804567 RepID=UPI003CED9C10
MKTQAMDKAKTAVIDCFYPFASQSFARGYPSNRDFQVVRNREGESIGVKARVNFESRTCIAKLSGYALSELGQHAFQISSRIYLYDRWFMGLIHHSCAPNTCADTDYLELWTVVAITAGSWITLDFALTFDCLHRQFACQCGAANCRGWIKGRKEQINTEGLRFLEQKCSPGGA